MTLLTHAPRDAVDDDLASFEHLNTPDANAAVVGISGGRRTIIQALQLGIPTDIAKAMARGQGGMIEADQIRDYMSEVARQRQARLDAHRDGAAWAKRAAAADKGRAS